MNLKMPLVLDTSKWENVPDWAQVNPRPVLVIPKATEGTNYLDPNFVRYMTDLKQDGIARGCFHFHRKAYNPITQAQWFCNSIRAYINKDDILVLDVEEGGETAAQLQQFVVYTQAQFPDNIVMIYSRKNILDPIPMTQTQKDFFKQIPIWSAGYPANPDIYSEPPSWYIPDRTKYGPTMMWQYGEAIIQGVQGEIDVNWISPVLLALLPNTTPQPPADVISTPHAGMTHISGVRYGWKFHLFINDPAKVRYQSLCLSPLETPSSVARRTGATLVVNGGEWDRVSDVKDYTVSDGVVCKARVESVPSLMILKNNTVFIDHVNADPYVQEALSGLRYLIQSGAIKTYLYGTEPQYTEGHARSIHAVNAQGHHMVMQSEGVYPNHGLTLLQCAEIMRAYGAVTAFDSGGGGDVACILDGVSLIVPENINPDTGAHFERALPNVFCIYAQGDEPMPEPFDYYEYTATGNRAIRVDWGVSSGRIASNSDFLSGKKARGGATDADRHILTQTDVAARGGMVNDVWVKLYDNNGEPVNGWTAKIHMGVPQVTEVFVPAVPVPQPGNKAINVTIDLDGYKPKTITTELEPE